MSDEVDGEMADHGHVPCAVSFPKPALVFLEDDIENPGERVLDRPRAPDGFGGLRGREGG